MQSRSTAIILAILVGLGLTLMAVYIWWYGASRERPCPMNHPPEERRCQPRRAMARWGSHRRSVRRWESRGTSRSFAAAIADIVTSIPAPLWSVCPPVIRNTTAPINPHRFWWATKAFLQNSNHRHPLIPSLNRRKTIPVTIERGWCVFCPCGTCLDCEASSSG